MRKRGGIEGEIGKKQKFEGFTKFDIISILCFNGTRELNTWPLEPYLRALPLCLKSIVNTIRTRKNKILKVLQNLIIIQSDPGIEHMTFGTVPLSTATMLKFCCQKYKKNLESTIGQSF